MKRFLLKLMPAFLPFILLAILIAAFFLRLFIPKLSVFATPDFGLSDLFHGYYQLRYLLAEGLKHNSIPLWTDKIATGYPIFADGQIGFFSLFNLILFKAFPLFAAINLSYFTAFLFAGVGTYFFSRQFGLNSVFSLLSAAIFTFSGFMILQINHLSLLQAASFLPWYFYFGERMIKKSSVEVILAFSLMISQQIFIGHQQITLYSIISIYLYLIVKLHIHKNEWSTFILSVSKQSFFIGIALGGGFLLSAVLLLPSFELYKNALINGQTNNPFVFPYALGNILYFIFPFYFGSPQNGSYNQDLYSFGIFWENNGYVGILPVIALFGIWLFRGKKTMSIIITLGIVMLLVLGKNSPLYFIYDFFPLNAFRVPSRFLMTVDLLLAVITGFFFMRVFSRWQPGKLLKYFSLITLFSFQIGIVFFYFYKYHPIIPVEKWYKRPDLVKELQKDKGNFRVYTIDKPETWNAIFFSEGWQNPDKYLSFRDELLGLENAFWDIDKANFQTKFITKRMKIYHDYLKGNISISNDIINPATGSAKLLGLMNVKYMITSSPVSALRTSKKINNYYISENPYFQERFRLVYDAKMIHTKEEFIEAVESSDFSFAKTILTEGEVKLKNNCKQTENSCSGIVRVVTDDSHRLILTTESNQDALLLIANSFYPGWRSFIDGHETKILPANINQQAVQIPKGRHEVEFEFNPESYQKGLTISGISYVLIAGFLIAKKTQFRFFS